MKTILFVPILLLPLLLTAQSNPKDSWSDWAFLLGEWTAGAGSGVPGQASKGSFTLKPDLGGAVLVRKNHAEYPPAGGRPAIVHDDLMIIYREGGATKAFYADSEGHAIHYHVTLTRQPRRIVFRSENSAGPRYRLTYDDVQPDAAKVLFEIAPPDKPGQFSKYVEATLHRKR